MPVAVILWRGGGATATVGLAFTPALVVIAAQLAGAPKDHRDGRRVGGLQKKLRHEPRIAPDDAPSGPMGRLR